MCRFFFSPALVALLLWGGIPPVAASSAHANLPAAEPEHRILVEPLGYRPPGSLYLLSDRTFSTLDFIDADHLLFTFHQSRLLRRETGAGKGDRDQIIQALTLKLPEGAVEASAEWRMHDRDRYLWPIGGGKFLVRQRDSYQLTDSSLELKPYIEVATPVQATEVSPDGRILVIEHEFERHTAELHNKLEAQAEKFGDDPPREDTEITLLDTGSRRTLSDLQTESPIHLPATAEGYVGVKRDKDQDQFVLTFYPFDGHAVTLGKVGSTCTPHENFLNTRALLIESCGPKTSDAYLDAWSTDGKKLWTAMRESHLVWPTFAYAATGNRFAVGLLRVTHAINLADSLNDEDVRDQVVQVYEVATGALLLTVAASPVLAAGQNFALSADGNRLAVLHQGAIEIYRLPPLKQ